MRETITFADDHDRGIGIVVKTAHWLLMLAITLPAWGASAQGGAQTPAPSGQPVSNTDPRRALFFRRAMPLAYQHVAIAAMLKEVNDMGPKLSLSIHFPVTEDDLIAEMAPPTDMLNTENGELPCWGGMLRTPEFMFSFSDNGRLCYVIKEGMDWPGPQKSLINNYGAYRIATNWLAQFPVDIGRLEKYGYANFAACEIRDAKAFVTKVQDSSDELSAYLRDRMGRLVADSGVVAWRLNPIVLGPFIYTEDRFHGISLRPETLALVKKINAEPVERARTRWNALDDSSRCNRMLLEDAYPKSLSKMQGSRPTVEHELSLGRQMTGNHYRPLFKVSWGPRIEIEIDGRTKELRSLRLEDDSVSQRPVGLFKNRDDLLKVPDQQFLGYSNEERKAFIEKFLADGEGR